MNPSRCPICGGRKSLGAATCGAQRCVWEHSWDVEQEDEPMGNPGAEDMFAELAELEAEERAR